MDNAKLDDVLFEAIFRQAVIENHWQELDEIPSEEELAKVYTFSELHNERMRKLFASDERKERLARLYRGSRKGAAIILITSGILFAILMTTPSVQAAVTEVFVEWYEQFTKFTSRQGETIEAKAWSPSYLPDGFEVFDTFATFDMTNIRYADMTGQVIDFEYMPIDGTLSVNNEGVEYNSVVSDGITFHIFAAISDNETNTIIWEVDGYRLNLRSVLPVDVLYEIAYSVK